MTGGSLIERHLSPPRLHCGSFRFPIYPARLRSSRRPRRTALFGNDRRFRDKAYQSCANFFPVQKLRARPFASQDQNAALRHARPRQSDETVFDRIGKVGGVGDVETQQHRAVSGVHMLTASAARPGVALYQLIAIYRYGAGDSYGDHAARQSGSMSGVKPASMKCGGRGAVASTGGLPARAMDRNRLCSSIAPSSGVP
jgi:hypothetical protein